MRYWWVNQRHTWAEERSAGILWAPVSNPSGYAFAHWETMREVAVGDVVIHYVNDAVRALSTVTHNAVRADRPSGMVEAWQKAGRLVQVDYRDLSPWVGRKEIPDAERARERGEGPFTKKLTVKQGYLWPTSVRFGEWFTTTFAARTGGSAQLAFPAPGTSAAPKTQVADRRPAAPAAPPTARREPQRLPAEATEPAADMLRRLIGEPLKTVSGAINTVLAVGPHAARVATTKSPQGHPVPLAEIDAALAMLREHGFVIIHPDQIGHRSAFIGAVLLTIPGATYAGSPPVIRVDAGASTDAPSTTPGTVAGEGISFEGELSRPRTTEERQEQSELRRRLVGAAAVAECAFCGDQYPVRFLHAAHLKRRSVCSDAERRDLANIAVLACVFGCDALYEHGYISVDASGLIVCAEQHAAYLGEHFSRLKGRAVPTFGSGNAGYFGWHLENRYLGAEPKRHQATLG